MINRTSNTKKEGTMEFLVYKEGGLYVGVCLTFDIVEEGSHPVELLESIKEAAELHLETVIKNDLSDELLNRYAPEEYWTRYFKALKERASSSSEGSSILVVSPYYRSLTAKVA
ncbi:MAG: hypothetical protein Q7S26_04525 [bacterium]|nr:hypothetical protein [bacterium]